MRQFRKVGEALIDAVRKMGALNLRISVTKLPSDLFTTIAQVARDHQIGLSPGISEVMQGLQESILDVVRLSKEPFQKIVEQIAQVQLPEPYLSSALITSGLNSPILHSTSYSILVPGWTDDET